MPAERMLNTLLALIGSVPFVRFSRWMVEEKVTAVLANTAAGRACKPTLCETTTSFDVANDLSSFYVCVTSVVMSQLLREIDDALLEEEMAGFLNLQQQQ